jgi:transcriptional regulator with XRE-family HTH domain
MNFARVLREALSDHDLRQSDLADRVGVTQPTVSNWVRGRCKAPEQVEILIAAGMKRSEAIQALAEPEEPNSTVTAAIDADDNLDQKFKDHLRMEYMILLRLTAEQRAGLLPNQASKSLGNRPAEPRKFGTRSHSPTVPQPRDSSTSTRSYK